MPSASGGACARPADATIPATMTNASKVFMGMRSFQSGDEGRVQVGFDEQSLSELAGHFDARIERSPAEFKWDVDTF
jgi:hypothetical protein